MADGQTPGNGKTSPFGNGDGNVGSGGAKGGHDFLTDNSTPPNGKGRDFTKDSRPQSDARREVIPNPQEIPAGGVILKADPGPVSKTVTGSAPGPQERRPFTLKG